jgi:FG-GAP-like repeat/PASTA domain
MDRRKRLLVASAIVALSSLAAMGARAAAVGPALAAGSHAPITFSRPTVYPLAGDPWAIGIGDFNSDRKIDVVVADARSSAVSVLLGNGHGAFHLGGTFSDGGESPTALTVADFNADGKPDVAVANAYSADVSVLLGEGNGSLADARTYAVGRLPEQLASDDLNGDDKPDLVVPNLDSGDLSILLGDGDGTFQAASSIDPAGVLHGPFAVAVGDLNGDGTPDIAATNLDATTVAVLLGDGAGGYANAVEWAIRGHSGSVAIGDFNRDGAPDLVAASADANRASVLLGAGNGTFHPPIVVGTGMAPQRVVARDLNRDGSLDLVTANFDSDDLRTSVSVLAGRGDGRFTRLGDLVAPRGVSALAVADLNDDRLPDIATANFLDGSMAVWLQRRTVCRIPRVLGLGLTKARRLIARAHCSVGKISFAHSERPKGTVLSQRPRAGVVRQVGAAVNLAVSTGKS